jgi:parallel beta-helix repeat protein
LPSRLGSYLHAALLVFGIAMLALVLLASRPAGAQTPPPASGTWDVNDTTVWSSSVSLMGDLVVRPGGDLTLRDMVLTFWCEQKSEFGLKVEGGGTLTARNVVFQAKNASLPCKFILNWNSVAGFENCTIKNVGSFGTTRDTWGVYVHTPYANFTHCTITQGNVGLLVHGTASATIFGCTISDNYDRGIWCMYASPFIANNRLSNNSYGLYLEESPGLSLLNNDLDGNRREALAMDANSSVAEWTVDEPVSWRDSTILLPGNLTVREGGALTLERSLLRMISPPDSRRAVQVLAGGSLRLDRSTIEAAAGGAYAFITERDGLLDLEGSAVHGAGYDPLNTRLAGIVIGNNARINGSNLTGNLYSLVLSTVNAHVTNSTLGGSAGDAWLAQATALFINVQFNASRIWFQGNNDYVRVGWHLAAGAVWQNGRAAAGATLTVKDGLGVTLFDGAPGPDGWVRWIDVYMAEFRHNGSKPLGPVSIVAKRAGLPDISRSPGLDSDREEAMVFTDPAPPTLVIESPRSGFGTNQSWVLISGTASDDIGLDRVELRVDESVRWTALRTGEWSFNLTNLSRGDHRVQVRATDMAGQSTWANLTLTVDFEPPLLALNEPFDESVLTNTPGVRFRGRTDADAFLTIDGLSVAVDASGEFDAVVNFTEGRHDVLVLSRDRGGNTASAHRNVTVDRTPPPITIFSPANGTRTRLDEIPLVGRIEPGAKFRVDGSTVILGPDGGFNVTVLLSGGPKDIELYAEDRAGNSNTTTWRLDRTIDTPSASTAFQKYGLALAVLAVLLVIVLSAVAIVVVRRKKRAPPPAAPRLESPPPALPRM